MRGVGVMLFVFIYVNDNNFWYIFFQGKNKYCGIMRYQYIKYML